MDLLWSSITPQVKLVWSQKTFSSPCFLAPHLWPSWSSSLTFSLLFFDLLDPLRGQFAGGSCGRQGVNWVTELQTSCSTAAQSTPVWVVCNSHSQSRVARRVSLQFTMWISHSGSKLQICMIKCNLCNIMQYYAARGTFVPKTFVLLTWTWECNWLKRRGSEKSRRPVFDRKHLYKLLAAA